MNRIGTAFNKTDHKALIPYVTVGYPGIKDTLSIVPALAEAGADIIELGIPFSDPLADGATIQKASYNALKNGVSPKTCLEVAGRLSKQITTPLAFMSYSNPIFSYGFKKFCRDSANAGVSAFIIPDLPPEEAIALENEAKLNDIDLIYFLAPTTSESRIRFVASRSSGFIYLVSVAGVTGARNSLPADLGTFVERVKKETKIPVCVGFGISTPEQAKNVASIADGVIIGSRIIQLMETEGTKAAANFIKEVRKAVDGR